MTITSGLAQVGKTHLTINLALELVRRGRLAGVFHDPGQTSAVDDLLDLQRPEALLRRAEDNDEYGIMRRGYQGVDILSCKMPMRLWPDVDAEQRSHCMRNIDVQEGYDDFLIDTSGMDAHSLLACCKASAVVILIVTPEARSQAEGFALLRVLQLNGFSGELYLLVNKALYPVDLSEIYNNFSRLLKSHLGIDVILLGGVPEDHQVMMAERNRQAFSSLFPGAAATGGVVVVADTLGDVSADFVAGPQTLAAFLEALVDVLQAPVCLPGGAVLEDAGAPVAGPDEVQPDTDSEQVGEMSLLQYAGDAPGLWHFLEALPLTLRSLSQGLEDLVTQVNSNNMLTADDGNVEFPGDQVLPLLARLLAIFRAAAPAREIELEVTDMRVTGQQQSWLQAGRYLQYTFRLPQEPLPEAVAALLGRVSAITRSTGSEGEEICELLTPTHNSCLSVISSSQACTRIQVWLPVIRGESLAGLSRAG
jgi:MinD-like ATPase involved in chromosome partitioning or flagellar assembly